MAAASLRAEDELILRSARLRVDGPNAARIKELLQENLDWAYVLRSIVRHGLAPLVHSQWEALCRQEIPAPYFAFLASCAEKIQRKNEFLAEEAARIAKLFEEAGIAALASKEMMLTASLFGNARREMDAVDFLVSREDLQRAKEVLRKQDYIPEMELSIARERAFVESQGGMHFYRLDYQAEIALRTAPGPGWLLSNETHKELWQRGQELTVGGRRVRALAPQDLLLAICAQSAERVWEKLAWVCDVAETIGAHPQMDWAGLRTAARRNGHERILLLGFHLAGHLRGTLLPKSVARALESDRAVRALAEETKERVFRAARTPARTPETSPFYWKLCGRWSARLCYARHFVFTPTVADWQRVSLPDSLFPLYRFLRPLRLAWRAVALLAEQPLRRTLKRPKSVSKFLPTPMKLVDRMLELAEVGPGDVVYDLGCGDGRILIEAAKLGARGVGVDLDSARIIESRANAQAAGVEQSVQFVQGDAMSADVSPASVVMLYLTSAVCLELRPRLEAQLRPGARVVSHSWDLGYWDKAEVCDVAGFPDFLYLLKVTAREVDPATSAYLKGDEVLPGFDEPPSTKSREAGLGRKP